MKNDIKRRLSNRMATIISKMDEFKDIIAENGLEDEEPRGLSDAHQEFIQWYMDNSR